MPGTRAIALCLVVSGCTRRPLGPALIGVYLGSETDVASLLALRIDAWTALLANTRFGQPFEDLPISGASVQVVLDGERTPLEEI